ncbi:MAG TPA: histidine kinase dimerization/phospho-acceptor domain-containing protein [Actinomycetaceae bacterium]|nr:histidine kinase dimerization/phospho-acceptor domain-containing protein [Actinomycetaceae bacterium]
MRRRAVLLAVVAVAVALVLIGLPLAMLGSAMIWESQQSNLDTRAQTLARAVERRLAQGDRVDEAMLDPWIDGRVNHAAHIIVILPDGDRVETPEFGEGRVLRSTRGTGSIDGDAGATVIMEVLVRDVQTQVAIMLFFVGAASVVAFVVAVLVALRGSRRLAAPLIYLAAAAEQLGSGQTRPNVQPSGIEEIDLVQDELVRSADRMAARLAAERQFAADASHQLRTPLTSLSMRLEEIQYISDNEQVKSEAELCLQQVERLTGVVNDMLRTARKAEGGTTAAVRLDEVFAQQLEEWREPFRKKGRNIEASDKAQRIALASPGALAQVLATLIENSLKYGDGDTTISTRPASGRGVFIDVADEGPGVSDELAPNLFSKGVSGHGSTGVGLALAKDLVIADGGRLDLTQRRPPIFTVFLNGLPRDLAPDVVMPQGALVTVGRRRRRR